MARHIIIYILLLGTAIGATAQTLREDSADVFFRHLDINEVRVTGLTGQSRMKEMPAPVSIVTARELQATASTNIIDAISRQPGVSQVTTGGSISKPVIRGLGFNRVAVVSDGIRQEGQQWGDEHGIETDAAAVGQVEIMKGPASLMYGSDAMAGVVILHPWHTVPQGEMRANATAECQTNNGLLGYSVNFAGNEKGMVWDGRWSQKAAHAYKNERDGYVPGSQFAERAARMMAGTARAWGHSHIILSYYHLTPSIVEGERDALTGCLLSNGDVKSYSRALPFQNVDHYKVVSDNMLRISDAATLKALVGYQQNQRQEYEETADDYSLYFKLHTLNYDLRYIIETGNGAKLAAGCGGMWQRSQNLGDEYLIPAYRLLDIGAFATATQRLGQWNITGGLRYDRRTLHSYALTDDGALRFDDFHRSFNGMSASIGAVYNITNTFDLRINMARGFRAPNMSELGSNGVHEGTMRYEQGNQRLNAEKSWQVDVGIDVSARYLSAQVALFANRISDYIFLQRTAHAAGVNTAGLPLYSYASGDARLLGFEAMVDVHPVHRLHLKNSFAMVDARQLNQPLQTRYLPFTPAPRWNAELKYEITHNGRVLNNTYVVAELQQFFRQSHYRMADATETATPAYTLLGASAGTDILHRGRHVASLYVTADNLLNRSYQNHLSRLKYTGVNTVTGRMGICNMGRNIAVKIVVPISFSSNNNL